MKETKGRYTKQNVWDKAAELDLRAGDEKIDRGTNYFVLRLNEFGLRTLFSCEGHPNGFYITFQAPYTRALEFKGFGYFSFEIEGKNYWSIRINREMTNRGKIDCLRWAAERWDERLGKINWSKAVHKSGFTVVTKELKR